MKALCLISLLAIFIFVDCKQDLDYVIYDLSKAEELFAEFRHDFGKRYSSQKETEQRFAIFVHNLKQINKINSQHLTWVAGINQFADMTTEEVQKCCMGLKKK
ncbi:hypothetical protein MSG28_007958 [Choristoneura fumiferana]|uniref:Uncharacterized protein n=1 Tax=Choristoneura fumiferana TaxID=7141 RepID=A0ACC0J9Q6_CHOFU|nr:hypothetical protein MSG28_007958 [Choristoneura fumiferana]